MTPVRVPPLPESYSHVLSHEDITMFNEIVEAINAMKNHTTARLNGLVSFIDTNVIAGHSSKTVILNLGYIPQQGGNCQPEGESYHTEKWAYSPPGGY